MRNIDKLIDKHIIVNLKRYGNCVIQKDLCERIDEILTYLRDEYDLDCELRIEIDNLVVRSGIFNKLVRIATDKTYILEVKR